MVFASTMVLVFASTIVTQTNVIDEGVMRTIAFLLIVFVQLWWIEYRVSASEEPWALPVLPPHYAQLPRDDFHGKLIPRHLWLTFRKAPSSWSDVNPHLRELFDRHVQCNWTIHLWSDQLMNQFMDDKFSNTSILWAYKMIHPRLGVSRADIWRYCVLWYYGGVYIDDDSSIGVGFDEVRRQRSHFDDSLV